MQVFREGLDHGAESQARQCAVLRAPRLHADRAQTVARRAHGNCDAVAPVKDHDRLPAPGLFLRWHLRLTDESGGWRGIIVSVLPLVAVEELVGEDAADFVAERLCHNGLARRTNNQLALSSGLFSRWYRRHGRFRLLPPAEQEIRDLLLDHLEPRLRRLCDARLQHTPLKNCQGWRKACTRGSGDRFFFSDYFQLINSRIDLFEPDLKFLGSTTKEIKRRLSDVEKVLAPVRNDLCHPKGIALDEATLAKAKGFALELLGQLPDLEASQM